MEPIKLIPLRAGRTEDWANGVENLAVNLTFDLSKHLKVWPEALPSVAFERADGEKYPHEWKIEGNVLHIPITTADTAVAGVCKCMITLQQGESRDNTEIFYGNVTDGLDSLGEEPDEPMRGIIEQVNDSANAAKNYAESAANSAQSAANAATNANEAKDAAQNHANDAEASAKRAEEAVANMGNGTGLPEVTEEDNGKMPIVQNGEWAIEKPSQYNGAFVVSPTPDGDQVLATKGMYMYLDLVVEEIPYSEVTNTANGTTVTIG